MMDTKRSRLAVALALVAFIAPQTFSAPTTRSTCNAVCRKSLDSKTSYEDGKSYTYTFETEVLTQVIGTTEETSKIKIKGQAVISAQSACDFILTLNQVAIQSPSGQAINKVDDIEGSSLRFSYQNGEIESVCVSEDDSAWSANVKRAVISMLTNKVGQDTSEVVIESDIAGQCPTSYVVSGDKYVKTRSLNACSHREGGFTSYWGVEYNTSSSNYNSLPFIDSSLTCTQELKNGIFQTVACVETHKLPLISTDNSGIHTDIKSSLSLVSTQNGNLRVAITATKPSSIFYDHSQVQDVQKQKASASRAVEYLNKICQEIDTGAVSSKVPGYQLQLIKTLKSIRKDDLKQMYEKVTNGGMCSKATQKLQTLLVDAAATSASDGSIAFLSELVANDKLGCNSKNLFYAFTSFAPRPNIVALQALDNLISKTKDDQNNLLIASALGHRYCKMTNSDCGSNNEYRSLVDNIAQHVRSGTTDEEEVRKVITALQSLGNLDKLTPAAVVAITNIINDKSASDRLKIRALDAFRRDPCQTDLKKKAIEIFGDKTENTDIRIQAYLTLSKCINQDDVSAIQQILNTEESSHVGSFVATHVENVVESASPSKDNLKPIFRQFVIPEGLSKNARKFSRNSEYSTLFKNFNLGGSVEGNVIFSQDSYIPRIMSTNLTVDAFGRSYNFMEFGIYAEQFEHIIEKYFGPSGKVKNTDFKKLITEGSEKLEKLVQNVRRRFTRDVETDASQNEIDAIREKVHIEERTGDNGVGDVYIRILGTSILAESFSESGLKDGSGSLSKNIRKGIEQIVDGAKDHKFDLTNPIVFADEEFVVPTFSGLPLNLKIEGTSILSLQMNGNLDIKALLRGENSDMRAKIIPSAATIVRSRMTVGAGPIESGLQLEGKVHSSSGVDLKLVKESGKFEFRFNLPQERTQVIDIRSDLYWVEQAQENLEKKTPVQSKLATKSLVDNDCTNTLSKLTGLKVCMDMKIPQMSRSAPFPYINGQSVLSVSIEKSEPSMEGYYLKIEKNSQDGENIEMSLLLDTPGSRTNRKISANLKGLKYKSTTPQYLFNLESPWTKLDVDYKRSATDDLKGVEIKVTNDGNGYNGKLQLKKVKAGGINKYEPIAQYTLPGGKPVNIIEGQVVYVEGQGKAEIDLRTAGPMKSLRASAKGTIEVPQKSDGSCEIKASNLELSSAMLGKLVLDGHIKKSSHVFDTNVQAKYGENAQHSLEFVNKISKEKHGHYKLHTKTRSSRRSFLNFDLNAEIQKDGNTCKSELDYTRGQVHISHKLEATVESAKKFEIHQEAKFQHPDLHLDVLSKIDAKAAPGEPRHAELVFNVNSFKSIAKYNSNGQNLLDYDVKVKAEYADKKYEFTEVSSKVSDHKQNFKNKLSVTPGFWYAGDTDVTYKYEKNDDFESLVSSTITSDQFSDPIVFKTGVRAKSDGCSALLKFDMKGKNYVDFTNQFKYSKSGKPATVNTKAFLLDYLDAKYAQTMSRSQCDVSLDVKWIPTGRKIEAKSKLNVDGEVYSLDSNIKWDAERDQSKSASLKSVTTVSFSSWQFDSKNDITVEEKLSKLNLKGKRMKEFLNGESTFEVDYTSQSGKSYNFASVINLENKIKSKAGKLNVKITLPEQQPYQLTWDSSVKNLNSHERTYDAFTDIKMDYKGKKDAHLRLELASLLPGNYRSYTGKVIVGGSIIPEPVSAELKADLKKGKWSVKGAANQGTQKSDVDVLVEYDVWSPKKTLNVKYTLHTPYDMVKTLEGQSKYAFLYNSWRSFEYEEDNSISLNNGNPAQWKLLASVMNQEMKYLSEVINDGETVYALEAYSKVAGKKILSELQVSYKNEKAFLNLDIEHDLPNFVVGLKGSLSSITPFELKIAHKKASTGVYETDLLAKSDSEVAFRVTNKVELSPDKKSIDLMISAAEEPTRRVYLLLNREASDKYNVEALLRWGDGNKFASTKGELRSSDGFDASLTLDSPEFKTNKMNIKISKKSENGRHSLKLNVFEQGKVEKLSATFDFGTKEEKSGAQKVCDGTVVIKGDLFTKDVNFNGKFRLEDGHLSRARGDGENGRAIKGSLEVGKDGSPYKLNALLKSSDKEKRGQVSVCQESQGKCHSGDIHFRHQHEINGDLEYTLRIVAEKEVGGQKSATGVSIRTTKTENGRQMDHTVKLILNSENSEHVGYRFYRKDGNELGAEILLPERSIATVLTVQHPKITDLNVDISFYIDKLRKPERKISMIFNTERKERSSGIERDTEVVFRHPDMGKDLKVSSTYLIGGDNSNLLDVKTIVDIFKAGSEVTLVYKAQKDEAVSGYKSEWSVKSVGQSINFSGKSEISRVNGQFSYKHEAQYENREGQMKAAKIEAVMSMKQVSFDVNVPSGKFLSYARTIEELPLGYQIRHEYLLPGMDNARIIQTVLQTSSPRKVQTKTYMANDPSGVYYEAIIGFRDKDNFVAGVFDHDSSEEKVLASFNVALSNNRILNVKTVWEKDNIKNVWTKAQGRVERTGRNLKGMITSSSDELLKEMQFHATNLRKASPNLKPVITATKDQLADLGVELDGHPETKLLIDNAKVLQGYFKRYVRVLIGLAQVARRLVITVVYAIKENLEQLPEILSEYSINIPYTMEDVQKCVDSFATKFFEFAEKSFKMLGDAADCISKAMPEIINKVNKFLDMTTEWGDCLRDLVEKCLNKAAIWWRSIRKYVKDIIDNDLVKMFVQDVIATFQMMLAEFIEETKNYAETFKDYLIKSVPEADFQELVQMTAEYVEKKAKGESVDDTVMVKQIYEKIVKIMKKISKQFFTIDADGGVMIAKIPLPVSIDSLSELPKIFEKFTLPSPPTIKYNVPSFRFGIREILNKLRHGAGLSELIPPYDGFALLVGSQFYKTFDGSDFKRVKGDCQYVLASDFEDGNFTVLADFDTQNSIVQKSIIVKDAQDAIAIKPDSTVVINGRTVSITDDHAETTNNFKIERMHDWIVISGKGIKAGCSSQYDVCAVKVSGFYQGKVMGLFGKFNHEKFDDLTTPEGQIIDSDHDFASSWTLNNCKSERVIDAPFMSQEAQEKCAEVFDSKYSSLRPCYGVVAAETYQRSCEKLSVQPGYDANKAKCTASTAYAKACKLSFAKVDVPQECRKV